MFILLLLTGLFSPGSNPRDNKFVKNETLTENTFTQINGELLSVVVYSSPSCGCCSIYADYLNNNGLEPFLKRVQNLIEIKETYMVPRDQWSCHTGIFGDYFIEGHIPLSVVYDLLSQKPNIDGISLPDMPLGTPGMGADNPGMGGEKNSEWVISSILNGQVVNVFARV